jgi:hypothetical protein
LIDFETQHRNTFPLRQISGSDAAAGTAGFNSGMILLEPIVEVAAGSWLVVDGARTVEEAGLFISLLAQREGLAPEAGAAEAVSAILEAETLILPGGLRATDTTTGKQILPGCCAGLEAWRDWTELLEHRQPWLGHDPGPRAEFRSGRLRLWQDNPASSPRRRGHRNVPVWVEITETELPGLLLGVQRRLSEFLSVLYQWAEAASLGTTGLDLVATIDRAFAITAPLKLSAS